MKRKKMLFTAITLIGVFYGTQAQTVGARWGNSYDLLVVNDDSTNHFGQMRLQTDSKAFTFSNLVDRMSLSYSTGAVWTNYGNEIFTVESNGNVGIKGITNPNGEMQFPNIINNRKIILWEDFNNDHQFSGFGINAGILRYQTTTSHAFFTAQSATSSKEAMRIINNGNVGIGTASPTQNLEVANNAIVNNLFLGDVGLGTGWNGLSYKAKNSNTTYALGASSDGKYTVINKQNTNDGYLGFRVGNQDKMVISNDGKVGIGTTTPNGELQFKNTQLNKKIVLWEDGANDHQFYGLGINTSALRYQSNGDHVFYSANDATSSKETLRVYKTGGIKTDKVVLNISTFPDYVFEEKYNLKPLEEVAKYIRENKHLPNVPSEKEVVANGLNIGEMNVKMVEKIEELTLYTIEQNEKIKSQETLIKSLMSRLAAVEEKINGTSK